jgi:hypothetical protein
MSLIADALKKAELQRLQPSSRATIWDRAGHANAEPRASAPRSARFLFAANVAVLALICVSALYFVRNNRSIAAGQSAETNTPAQPAVAAATPIPAAEVPTAIAEAGPAPAPASESDFVPATFNPAKPPVTDDYVLGGTSTLGSSILLSIIRKSDRRSLWIPVGKTIGEVTAVNYDSETDQAVIRVRGNLLSVTMRESVGTPVGASEPAAVPAE